MIRCRKRTNETRIHGPQGLEVKEDGLKRRRGCEERGQERKKMKSRYVIVVYYFFTGRQLGKRGEL